MSAAMTDHRTAIEDVDRAAGPPLSDRLDQWAADRRRGRIAYLAEVAGLDPDRLPDQVAADLRHLANLEDSDGLARIARLLEAAAR